MATKGISELEAALSAKHAEIETALQAAVRAEANDIAADERRLIPVVTGELSRGIEARVSGTKAEVGIWDTKLFWAVWIEWGRKNATPRPFATPASETARSRWRKRAETTVRKVID